MSQPKVRIAREAVVRHDARLDILCCLDPDEPMAAEQVSARTGMSSLRRRLPPEGASHLRAGRYSAEGGHGSGPLCAVPRPPTRVDHGRRQRAPGGSKVSKVVGGTQPKYNRAIVGQMLLLELVKGDARMPDHRRAGRSNHGRSK